MVEPFSVGAFQSMVTALFTRVTIGALGAEGAVAAIATKIVDCELKPTAFLDTM
jgi:hypothetical protein